MDEDFGSRAIEHKPAPQLDHVGIVPDEPAPIPEAGFPQISSPSDGLPYGRGNAPVRAAMLQRMQRTYGNRAVQRYLRVQRAPAAPAGASDDAIAERIQSRSGGGSSLDRGVQRTLEQGLGADLSGVRVHTDGEADHLARSVDSVAFTTGNDIFFRQGAYDPSTSSGMHLIAHEATHTVQQSQGPVAGTPTSGGVSVSDPSDPFEQAAEQAASTVLAGRTADAQPGGGSSVQREATKDDEEEQMPAQTMRSSQAVQREATKDDDEEQMPAQTMRTGTPIQREATKDDDEEQMPAQTMRTSTAVQRHAADEEHVPAQTMRLSAPVQREAGKDEEEQLPAQTMRASQSVQREATKDDDEEQMPAQTMRTGTPIQREAAPQDAGYAGPALGSLPSRGATVVQRSLTGDHGLTLGTFHMDMITKEEAGSGAGTNRSGLKGSIAFLPKKDAPYSNKIGLIQIVKLTDAGGANANPASLPTAYGPDLRTKEDKKGGVEGGFFTDVLHHDFGPANKDVPKGSAKPLYYEGGAPRFGFKRSDDVADIESAELQDFPSTDSKDSNLDFSFETVAKGDDTMQVFGSVKWAFGLRKGKVVNESQAFTDAASATFAEAVEKHRDFYVHEPVTFYFGFDQDTLEGGEDTKIDTFLDYLRRFPDVKLNLEGFADRRGSVAYNRDLATRRTGKLAQALIDKGIDRARINSLPPSGRTTQFTSDAITDQDKEANRRGNRRVMLTFEHVPTTGAKGTP